MQLRSCTLTPTDVTLCYGAAMPSSVDETNARLRARYLQIRRATAQLCEPLTPEDCQAQSMPDASPVKWHLAHSSWFFETFVLEASHATYRTFHPAYRVLFNS